MPADPSRGAYGADLIACAAIVCSSERTDVDDLSFGENLRSMFFSQVEVAEIESVFGTKTATHHATATAEASGAVGALSFEEGVRKNLIPRLSFRGLKNPHLGAIESGAHAGRLGGLF